MKGFEIIEYLAWWLQRSIRQNIKYLILLAILMMAAYSMQLKQQEFKHWGAELLESCVPEDCTSNPRSANNRSSHKGNPNVGK